MQLNPVSKKDGVMQYTISDFPIDKNIIIKQRKVKGIRLLNFVLC